MTASAEALREQVRRRYAESARAVAEGSAGGCGGGSCCADDETTPNLGELLYAAEERGGLPDAAVLASLGCGNPTAVADLREGESVLDLGSGGGIDLILSAKRVGPTGRVFGLDMTDEMLSLARRNIDDAGIENIVLLKGVIEQIPLPANSINVIISNCVSNAQTGHVPGPVRAPFLLSHEIRRGPTGGRAIRVCRTGGLSPLRSSRP